ncbi:MAG: hypothetical protein ABI835_17540 [Chloroflexota bacterium]
MAWPNPNEYVEAIQHPQQAFSDPALRAGKVITNRLGLPRPISGNFATVFEVKTDQSRWAVRCFLREVTNQQQRYAAIAAHLKLHALPCMVNFEYLPEGIRVRGKWFPILKMDWTAGTRLDTYIEAHLSAPHDLQQLAEQWITLCQSLRQAQIAHGDLQHGNILVNERDEIKLIDYDGMIVPDVIGLDNHEIGHRHYQHPTRKSDNGITLGNFERVDNFSCHVIGLSLLGLAIDAALWKATGAGEENLLFRDVDYLSPEKSKTFARLAQHEDQRVRAVGQAMLEAVRVPFYLDMPPFDRSLAPAQTRVKQVKSWLISQIAPDVAAPAPSVFPSSARPSWIFDHLEAARPDTLDFSPDFILHERISVEVEFQRSPFGVIEQLFPAFAVVQLIRRYPAYAIVAEKASIRRICRTLEQQLLEGKARRKTLSRMIVEMDRRYQQDVRTLEGQMTELAGELERSYQQETREIPRLERALQNALEDGQPSTSGTPISAEDVEFARQRYADAQRDLEDQLRNLQKRLDKIRANSDDLRLSQNLRDELDGIEAEVLLLQEQYSRAIHERARYELITLRRFLAKIAATAPF